MTKDARSSSKAILKPPRAAHCYGWHQLRSDLAISWRNRLVDSMYSKTIAILSQLSAGVDWAASPPSFGSRREGRGKAGEKAALSWLHCTALEKYFSVEASSTHKAAQPAPHMHACAAGQRRRLSLASYSGFIDVATATGLYACGAD